MNKTKPKNINPSKITPNQIKSLARSGRYYDTEKNNNKDLEINGYIMDDKDTHRIKPKNISISGKNKVINNQKKSNISNLQKKNIATSSDRNNAALETQNAKKGKIIRLKRKKTTTNVDGAIINTLNKTKPKKTIILNGTNKKGNVIRLKSKKTATNVDGAINYNTYIAAPANINHKQQINNSLNFSTREELHNLKNQNAPLFKDSAIKFQKSPIKSIIPANQDIKNLEAFSKYIESQISTITNNNQTIKVTIDPKLGIKTDSLYEALNDNQTIIVQLKKKLQEKKEENKNYDNVFFDIDLKKDEEIKKKFKTYFEQLNTAIQKTEEMITLTKKKIDQFKKKRDYQITPTLNKLNLRNKTNNPLRNGITSGSVLKKSPNIGKNTKNISIKRNNPLRNGITSGSAFKESHNIGNDNGEVGKSEKISENKNNEYSSHSNNTIIKNVQAFQSFQENNINNRYEQSDSLESIKKKLNFDNIDINAKNNKKQIHYRLLGKKTLIIAPKNSMISLTDLI